MHEVVRKHCMDYLVRPWAGLGSGRVGGSPLFSTQTLTFQSVLQMKNADYFSNYVTEDFTTYINRKRKNNCHGNHIEMQAMAEMYNRPVEVYQYSTGTSVVVQRSGRSEGGRQVAPLASLPYLALCGYSLLLFPCRTYQHIPWDTSK